MWILLQYLLIDAEQGATDDRCTQCDEPETAAHGAYRGPCARCAPRIAERDQRLVERRHVREEEQGTGRCSDQCPDDEREQVLVPVVAGRVEQKHQDKRDQNIDAAVVLGSNAGEAGGVKVEQHHAAAKDGH